MPHSQKHNFHTLFLTSTSRSNFTLFCIKFFHKALLLRSHSYFIQWPFSFSMTYLYFAKELQMNINSSIKIFHKCTTTWLSWMIKDDWLNIHSPPHITAVTKWLIAFASTPRPVKTISSWVWRLNNLTPYSILKLEGLFSNFIKNNISAQDQSAFYFSTLHYT